MWWKLVVYYHNICGGTLPNFHKNTTQLTLTVYCLSAGTVLVPDVCQHVTDREGVHWVTLTFAKTKVLNYIFRPNIGLKLKLIRKVK